MTRHPGQILLEDFLTPLGLNANRLAVGLGVNRSTVSRLLAGQQPLTPAMAARLGAFFHVPARWWLLMQAEHDAAMVSADPTLVEGVTPMAPDPDVLLTPTGVLRLAPPLNDRQEPVTITGDELQDLPEVRSQPAPREVREVRYAGGSIALVGDAS